jgi:hypothetical protein
MGDPVSRLTGLYLLIFFIGTQELECSKGKAIPLQAWAGLEHSRILRLPYFKVQVVRLSALRTSHLYPSGNICGTHSVRG